ncbi:hypothetical protein DMN91_008838 [Ooceraea biroi]|uniref:Uncharacterized protein n=1 Tax=Ooceraea biroi TaxID=2015173 RepID=A0A3L8DDT0_OOCBI|nr:hypothetical protein DMN91_008838 [Ooceraea biroi]
MRGVKCMLDDLDQEPIRDEVSRTEEPSSSHEVQDERSNSYLALLPTTASRREKEKERMVCQPDDGRKIGHDGKVKHAFASKRSTSKRDQIARRRRTAGEATKEHGEVLGLPKPPRPTCPTNRPAKPSNMSCLPISAGQPATVPLSRAACISARRRKSATLALNFYGASSTAATNNGACPRSEATIAKEGALALSGPAEEQPTEKTDEQRRIFPPINDRKGPLSADIVDADGIRGVLLGGAGWPFPWRPTHSLQTLEHPSPGDVVGTLSRVSPASATFPQRGEFDSSLPSRRRVPEQIETAYLG